ncbi:MAG TPA: c-type cytochrome [Solirubrobacteraceae bacterium]|jgi:mono/diheme cytochrome c family protein|nr:c-type cytochrome [Solirubrobacteraceae bacterium]
MSRLAKILAVGTAVVSVAVMTAACGTQHIAVPSDQAALHRGAVVFNERCAGCHTLSAAATYGSAPNIRTAQDISGPALDQRCERPVDRVLYAIANGGFSGAYMPQNVVVGQDAVDVAKFVATYAGGQAESGPGQPKCHSKPIGTLPAGSGTVYAGASSSSSASSTTSTSTAVAAAPGKSKSSKKGKSSSKKSSGS